MTTCQHFGETVRRGKYGFRLAREKYALPGNRRSSFYPRREDIGERAWEARAWRFADEEQRIYSDAYVDQQREAALQNFDRNMAFFARLDSDEFDVALISAVAAVPALKPVNDLRRWDSVAGVYIMVLDDYRQAYVGQASDIRTRIKQHWTGTKPFDRLVFGSPDSSVLSIDSFRSLDTTRIFAARTQVPHRLEAKIERSFPPDFLLNRVSGGILLDEIRDVLTLVGTMKKRELAPAEGGAESSAGRGAANPSPLP
ncbi:GIY-YIG nuclease family protein [Microbacterium wangruii]|uniref:GIY-YIG nuclease family protein n=1 Tax=Microbacterium wangruii TaxID=3049073 RepID=UPI00256EFCD8|nr:GIY-YIG nuclease family protein [Microbacterium sp. zg-Y1211]MDL5486025.1 GIY-YIG nuclease family protein [Microbacterium sp. zg-Y1211]